LAILLKIPRAKFGIKKAIFCIKKAKKSETLIPHSLEHHCFPFVIRQIGNLLPDFRNILATRILCRPLFMSFVSRGWSSETLSRGLGIVRSQSMSCASDPETEAMMAELRRLEEIWGAHAVD
jgi:hypothetical protein